MRAYTTFMMITGALALLLAVPGLAILLVYVTLGLALPLMFVQTLFVYGACFYPLVAGFGGSRTVGAAISVGAIAALAFLPGILGQGQAKRIAAEVMADDLRPSEPVAFRSLEIRRKPSDYADLFADNEACGLECRSLLLTGKVDWVRVVMLTGRPARRGAAQPSTSTFYRSGTLLECGVPMAGKAPASSSCVLMSADTGGLADLVIEFSQAYRSSIKAATKSSFMRFKTMRRVEGKVLRAGRRETVYRQSETESAVAFTPSVIAPEFNSLRSSGFEFQKSKQRINQISLTRALEAVGTGVKSVPGADPKANKPTNWRDGLTPALTRDVLSVLDLPGAEPFNTEQGKVISTWMMHARQEKEWTPEIVGILRRIVRDTRVRNASYFGQIFERNVKVAKALMPDLLDRMEAEEFGSDNTAARQAAYSFVRIDPQLLAPYRDRIIALARKGGRTGDIAMQAVGRLGVDPLPYLLPFEADLKAFKNYPRVSGACYAESKWAARLIPELRAALEIEPTQDSKMQRRYERFRSAVLATLANLGDVDFVRSKLEPGKDGKPGRLERQLDRLRGVGRNANWLCSF